VLKMNPSAAIKLSSLLNTVGIQNLNGEGDDGGRLRRDVAGGLDEKLRQLVRHVRLAGRRWPADDQPLLSSNVIKLLSFVADAARVS
jgi:hypothetical protein